MRRISVRALIPASRAIRARGQASASRVRIRSRQGAREGRHADGRRVFARPVPDCHRDALGKTSPPRPRCCAASAPKSPRTILQAEIEPGSRSRRGKHIALIHIENRAINRDLGIAPAQDLQINANASSPAVRRGGRRRRRPKTPEQIVGNVRAPAARARRLWPHKAPPGPAGRRRAIPDMTTRSAVSRSAGSCSAVIAIPPWARRGPGSPATTMHVYHVLEFRARQAKDLRPAMPNSKVQSPLIGEDTYTRRRAVAPRLRHLQDGAGYPRA